MQQNILSRKKLPVKGVVLSAIIGAVSLIVSMYTPSALNSVIIALVMGVLVNNLIKVPSSFQEGISMSSSKLLEWSILFLAFSINYTSVAALGVNSFISILVTVLVVLILTFYLSKKLNCPGATGYLVGFGTSICGSSAIAALAPSVVDAKNSEDVVVSMSVVNLLGSLGMILFPIIFANLSLTNSQMALLVGGSLHSVGNVAGAGYALGDEIGEMSLTIKLARVALLSPALIFFNYLVNRHKVKSWKEHFILPWYLIGFFLISIFVSFIQLPEGVLSWIDFFGKVALTIAMAAIGLKVSFNKLIASGKKGIGFGIIIFLIQIGLLTLFFLM